MEQIQFEMKDGRIAKKLYNKVKFLFPRWRKFRWLWHGAWAIWIYGSIWLIMDLHTFYGGFTAKFMNDMVLLLICFGVMELLTMPILYAILIKPAAEIRIAMRHSVILDETGLQSDWRPYPVQMRNVGGDHVIVTFPYKNIRRITWNGLLQRLEIYGEFIQKVHTADSSNQEWVPKERTYFTLCKKEKVLYLYNYFPDMEKLTTCLVERWKTAALWKDERT